MAQKRTGSAPAPAPATREAAPWPPFSVAPQQPQQPPQPQSPEKQASCFSDTIGNLKRKVDDLRHLLEEEELSLEQMKSLLAGEEAKVARVRTLYCEEAEKLRFMEKAKLDWKLMGPPSDDWDAEDTAAYSASGCSGPGPVPMLSPVEAMRAMKAALRQRRREEQEFYLASHNPKAPLSYIIDWSWARRWSSFVEKGGRPPGHISNERLLDSKGSPLPDLVFGEHWYVVNEAQWNFLHQRYGGGPVLVRKERPADLYGK